MHYHGGTGLLGQPSLVFGKLIQRSDSTHYYMLDILSHGHHSGSTGDLYPDVNTITTARYIVERLVVGVDEAWFVDR
ncbi:MAG: hypothetical protein RIA63_15780 [Cyclobacteriaceae bacterium]